MSRLLIVPKVYYGRNQFTVWTGLLDEELEAAEPGAVFWEKPPAIRLLSF